MQRVDKPSEETDVELLPSGREVRVALGSAQLKAVAR